jgi:hypothetical protein
MASKYYCSKETPALFKIIVIFSVNHKLLLLLLSSKKILTFFKLLCLQDKKNRDPVEQMLISCIKEK